MTIPTFRLPVFLSIFFAAGHSVTGRLDCTSLARGEFTPTDPDRLSCMLDSNDVLQDPGNTLLDRRGSLYRGFLSEVPKFPVLRGCDVEVLARLHG
jgi:hypothetical protein